MQTFEPSEIKYLYSPQHAPIGSVASGERFIVMTEDCFTGRFQDAADYNAESSAWVEANLNGVTGPISVDGASPGDAIEITIDALDVISPGCLVVSRCEALSPKDWWHEEDHAVNLAISDGQIALSEDWSVPVRPLIGCLGTAPGRESVLSRHEGEYGGNLDCGEITAGATVTLPVAVAGAYLYFGDCKAAMGDGEVVAAPEVAARITASARPVPLPAAMGCPRVRTAERLTAVVSGVSVADAARAAFRQLKHWIQEDWQLTSEEAAIVMGIGAHCGIGQLSNRLHTAKCSIALSLLPSRDTNQERSL